jgi:hypothetical protein
MDTKENPPAYSSYSCLGCGNIHRYTDFLPTSKVQSASRPSEYRYYDTVLVCPVCFGRSFCKMSDVAIVRTFPAV